MRIISGLWCLQVVMVIFVLIGGMHPVYAESISLSGDKLAAIEIQKPALYPEGIDYDPTNDVFIVGSFREGAVYKINLDGSYQRFINDRRLSSVLGVRVDARRNRVLVVNSDIGASQRPYIKGKKKLAAVGIYDLSSGKVIHYVDLGSLLPDENHLANGITLDDMGNAYITDSFTPVIYKVDVAGNASIFLKNDRFLGEGINLNGIVYHPDGFLITVKKNEGVLFKIPLENPSAFSEIASAEKFIGGDGVILANKKELLVIANRAAGKITEAVFSLKADDSWGKVNLSEKRSFGKVYLTTGVIRKNKIYVMHSNLKALIVAPELEKARLQKKATIQQVGTLAP